MQKAWNNFWNLVTFMCSYVGFGGVFILSYTCMLYEVTTTKNFKNCFVVTLDNKHAFHSWCNRDERDLNIVFNLINHPILTALKGLWPVIQQKTPHARPSTPQILSEPPRYPTPGLLKWKYGAPGEMPTNWIPFDIRHTLAAFMSHSPSISQEGFNGEVWMILGFFCIVLRRCIHGS